MKQSPTTQKKNKKTALVSKTKRKAAKDPNAWVASEDIKSKKVTEKRADRMEKRGWTKHKRMKADSPAEQHRTNSWEEEDVKRGREQEKEGHKGHAEALFDDAHDSYNWKGGNDGHESWFHRFKRKNPTRQLKSNQDGGAAAIDPSVAADELKRNQEGEGSMAKQTPFENLIQKYPDMPASDTLAGNDPRGNFGFDIDYDADLNKAFDDTYGSTEGWEIEDGDITDAEARAKALQEQKQKEEAQKTQALKNRLYEAHMLKKASPTPQHGQSKGDQSATHKDYANYKGTDKGYHGKDGSSHGDQSATHRDYVHPILKHMKR